MSQFIEDILKDNWYQTATPQEMRVELMHFEMSVQDSLSNDITSTYKKQRKLTFDRAMSDISKLKKELKR